MTLKGKNKLLRNIIVSLIAVVFIAGIAGVVYSTGKASVKIEFKGESLSISEELDNNKQWLINTNENEVKFIVDLSDYKMESAGSEGDGGDNNIPPIESEPPVDPDEPGQPEQPGEPEPPVEPENPDTEDQDTEDQENPPVDGVEEGNEIPDNVEVISEGVDIQSNEAPGENNGGVNTPENNETTDKVEVKYPELDKVMDIKISTENQTIEFGNTEITQYLEEGIFKGKYEVIIPLNKKVNTDDSSNIDEEMMVDTDFNFNVDLVIIENDFDIPATSNVNPSKKFTIVKDVTIPKVTITGVSENYSGPVENINIS